MSVNDFNESEESPDNIVSSSTEESVLNIEEKEYELDNGNMVIPINFTDVDAHPMQFSVSQIESNICASSLLPLDVCDIIAQYLLFDFVLKMDRSMIEYKSCKETTHYRIENMFTFSRRSVFCSRREITEFDVLIKLSLRNHSQTVRCIGDKYEFIQHEPDQSNTDINTNVKMNEMYLDEADAAPFMVCSFQVISPALCTAPLTDALIWVFNDRPKNYDLANRDIYNQRMDVNQLEYDINTNWKQRDETKPVAFIKDPPYNKLVSYKLPFGILGKYVFIKCMAQDTSSDNADVQYIGVTVARL